MLFDCPKTLEVINKIRKSILKKNETMTIDFARIREQYMRKMKDTFASE